MHSYEVKGFGRAAVSLSLAGVLMIWLLHVVVDAINFDPSWWLSNPSFAGF